MNTSTVVIGAGPAGLTAAHQLLEREHPVTVFEADDVVGGISRTVERDGYRFDIGGHRFFTKVPEVEDFWHRILSDTDFPVRPRLSRIFYDGKYYDYPLNAMNALRNLGVVQAARCMLSYAAARLRPPGDTTSFEGWVRSRFGDRLYRTFFKSYTEKVWGMPATEIRADWAAQRIKNLSLAKAVVNAIKPTRTPTDVTSLIEEFNYPRLGPGMMWEHCAAEVRAMGGALTMHAPVTTVHHRDGLATSVEAATSHGAERVDCDAVVSSMPLGQLLRAMEPAPPPTVVAAADGLRYRDFLTVALVLPESAGFPDNWIYVHSPEVEMGRIQNFGSWSADMVKPGHTCLGLEYFVDEGDWLWSMADDDLVHLGAKELEKIGLIEADQVERGYVVRMPKAYPIYDGDYAERVTVMRSWLEQNAANVWPVGRNGMHRYNNQDHSMYTAMLAVENILDDAGHDLWSVNVEAEYHEQRRAGQRT